MYMPSDTMPHPVDAHLLQASLISKDQDGGGGGSTPISRLAAA